MSVPSAGPSLVQEHAEQVEKDRAEKAARAAAEKEARRVAYESERERLKEEQARGATRTRDMTQRDTDRQTER